MSRSREGARTLLFQGAITFGATTLVNVLNYLFHAVGSRMLGPAGYGEIAALLNVLALASIPAAIAQLVVAKLAAELREPEAVRGVYDRLVRITAVAAIAVLIAGAIAAVPLAAFLRVPDVLPVLLTILVIASNVMLTSLRGILQGSERFAPFALSLSIEAAGKSVLGLALISHYGVAGALCGYAIGSLSSLAVTIVAIRRSFPGAASELYVDVRRLWQSSRGIAATQACLTALSFSDIVVVKHSFAPAEAGIYSVVALSGKVLLFLVGFVPLLVLPRAARAGGERNSHGVLLAAGAFLLVASGVVLGAYATFPQTVVRAMAGDAFLGAAAFIVPYGIAMTLLSATQIVTTYDIGQHRFRFVIPLGVVTLAEIATMMLVPPHVETIVRVLLVGNLCCLAVAIAAAATGAPAREARLTPAKELRDA